jgi:hypothetical protein
MKQMKKLMRNNSENLYGQSGGGILSNLFGYSDIEKLVLDSFSDGRPDVACYLLCKTNN